MIKDNIMIKRGVIVKKILFLIILCLILAGCGETAVEEPIEEVVIEEPLVEEVIEEPVEEPVVEEVPVVEEPLIEEDSLVDIEEELFIHYDLATKHMDAIDALVSDMDYILGAEDLYIEDVEALLFLTKDYIREYKAAKYHFAEYRSFLNYNKEALEEFDFDASIEIQELDDYEDLMQEDIEYNIETFTYFLEDLEGDPMAVDLEEIIAELEALE